MNIAGFFENMEKYLLGKCMEKCMRGGCLGESGLCRGLCYCYGVSTLYSVSTLLPLQLLWMIPEDTTIIEGFLHYLNLFVCLFHLKRS